jgi:hypothetical protein
MQRGVDRLQTQSARASSNDGQSTKTLRSGARARALQTGYSERGKGRECPVSVCVRMRALSAKEIQRGDSSAWHVDEDGQICYSKGGANVPKYAFDKVYQERSTNADVYKGTGAEIVHAAVQGINGTIFAYGACTTHLRTLAASLTTFVLHYSTTEEHASRKR